MHLLSLFSLRNRALIALMTIVIGIFGGIALSTLKQELIPSLTLPRLVIVTAYPGAAPAVVESDVSTPIETAIQGIEGLESTTATSRANVSTVSASFAYGTDITNLEQKVQLAINRIANLPDDVDPRIVTGSIDDLPVIQIAVTSDLDPRELSSRLESILVDIESLEGVREAALLGTLEDRVEIVPDVEALAANGLTTVDIEDALDANGVLLPAGEITEEGQTLVVQAGDRVEALQELQDIPLLTGTPGELVPLSSVAEVRIAAEPVTGISRVNGEPALTISVTKTPDGNTVAVSEAVRELIPELEEAVGSGTEFIIVFDQAPFIERSIEALATEGTLGLIFAIIIILVFLLSIRSTLVTAISIPASILITFIGMLAFDYTLNIITLGALTISVGRVVDDSIVVIENIKRHVELGEEKWLAITSAVREVAGAITASTVTTIAVFLPLALVSDITGELFRPFALTVSIALGASLFVSLTIVPVLAYWFLGRRKKAAAPSAVQSDEDELDHPTLLQRGYLPIIRWTLRRPIAVLLAAVLVLGGTGLLAMGLKTNFIGESGQNTLTVNQQLPLGTSLEARSEAAEEVEEVLSEIDGIEIVQLSIGSNGTGFAAFRTSASADNTFSLTTDPDADQEELQSRVRSALDELDGAGEISISAASSGFASSDINVNIRATTESELREAADAIGNVVDDLDIVAEYSSNLSAEQPYIAVTVDRAEAAEVGLSELAVGGLVAQAMNPTPSGTVVIDETTLSIYIERESQPVTIAELREFEVPTAVGPLQLTELADVEELNGPASITTSRGVRSATVSITPNSDDIGSASALIQEAIDEANLPAGASAELGGVSSQQSEAFEQLGLALLVSILIVYIVMVATFRSLRQPLLLLISVPFAATGAVLLQLASGIPLGAASLIGVIMLVGIVVTNAIVLIDLVNQYRERGYTVGDAILHGAARRLRPILMTAAATIFALTPLALGITGQGGFISQPLAVVVIGGLVSSTLLTLVVLPTLYYLVEGAKERRLDRRAAM